MTVQMIILYMDKLVTIINDLNLNLNLLYCFPNDSVHMHSTQIKKIYLLNITQIQNILE